MASAKKQEHLEAGKRRLEEFRKKKAADLAKKSANHHIYAVNADEHNKQPVDDHQREIHTGSNGAATSDGVSEAAIEPSQGVVINDEKETTISMQNSEVTSNDVHPNTTHASTFLAEIAQAPIVYKGSGQYDGLWSSWRGETNFSASPCDDKKNNDYSQIVSERHDQSTASSPQVIQEFNENTQHGHGQLSEAYLKEEIDSQSKDFKFANSGGIQLQSNSINGSLLDTSLTFSSNDDSVDTITKTSAAPFPQVWKNIRDGVEPLNSSISSVGERKHSDYFENLPSGNSTTFWPETNSRRSRPSFLDSMKLPKAEPSTFPKSFTNNERIQPYSMPGVLTGNENDMYRGVTNNKSFERDNFFSSRKQDEDFAALEQHIEDLTQEKFSLQRSLEASKTLADSLAAENSSLTDSYNQQGSIVNQLKSDMQMLQEEIKAHLVELQSVKMEYANAQLECTAADERAKLLASEVISLEEKALRLRSSELKLEKQLENSQAEFSSFKKKLSILEKDRQDLQSTIDSLREEKKLLQAKLRKATSNGKFSDTDKSLNKRKDVSTSTEDLPDEDETDAAAAGPSSLEMNNDAHVLGINSFDSFLLPENGQQFNLEGFSSSILPYDQLRMIQNINTLISELALEKEELMQALLAESSESSKMKELNKELTRKLEVQTQKLELLTAQSMSGENIPLRQKPDPRTAMVDNAPYADEGDEVVERVLGWIMKLFPGGPSRRRTSKLI